jgi:multidrug efflux system membrane fusion protein
MALLDGALTMEARGVNQRKPLGILIALLIVGAAVGLAVKVASRTKLSTDDASIDAEVIHVASAVGGRIIELPIHENELIHRGDLLLRIDPVPYQTNVAAAEAQLALSRATLESKRRLVSAQRSNAQIASEQTRRAQTNLELSMRTEERLKPLTAKGYVPKQQLDQAEVATQNATSSLTEAKEQETAAHHLVDDVAAAEAAVRAAAAALTNARRALEDTEVRAPHEGRIVGLSVSTGEMVIPSQSLFTLINTEEWFVSANFREIDLKRVKQGDCVTVYSMIDRHTPIKGVVDSIGFGVLSEDRINIPRSVPYVEPSLNWVRVAQRFPVRIHLQEPPEQLVRIGASAIAEVDHGTACR